MILETFLGNIPWEYSPIYGLAMLCDPRLTTAKAQTSTRKAQVYLKIAGESFGTEIDFDLLVGGI